MDARIFKGAFGYGTATASANTAIHILVPPYANRKPRITSAIYRCGSTVNALSFLRPLNHTTIAAAAVATATTLTLTANPGVTGNAAASNDWYCVELDNGQYQYGTFTLSSLTATVAALPQGVNAGAKFWWFGLPADTGNIQVTPAASSVNRYEDYTSGIFTSGLPEKDYDTAVYGNRSGFGDPVIVHSPYATAQCWIERISGYYAAT